MNSPAKSIVLLWPSRDTLSRSLLMSFCTFLLAGVQQADAAFVVEFDSSQTTVVSNGSGQTFTIDLLITHNGIGDSTFSGITIDLVDPGSDLTLSNPANADFAYPAGAKLLKSIHQNLYFIEGSSTTNFDVTTSATKKLMTIDFTIDASIVSHVFNLDMTLRDAKRGNILGSLTDSDVIVQSGFFTVMSNASAVPEPSSLLVFGVLAGASVFRIGRKRRKSRGSSADRQPGNRATGNAASNPSSE